jgi:hypothetical protein
MSADAFSRTTRGGSSRRGLAVTAAVLLALSAGAGEAAAQGVGVGRMRVGFDQGNWVKSGAVFLVISALGAYSWYFGLFPRLLRKDDPSWPLDAWRQASYGAWVTTCLAAYAFKKPMIVKVVEPLLRGSPDALITYFMELILLPLLALVGLLVIWNFRRDATNRARP